MCRTDRQTDGRYCISVSSVAEVTASVELPWLSCIWVNLNIFFFLCRILFQKYYASLWQGVRTHPTPLVCLRHCRVSPAARVRSLINPALDTINSHVRSNIKAQQLIPDYTCIRCDRDTRSWTSTSWHRYYFCKWIRMSLRISLCYSIFAVLPMLCCIDEWSRLCY